MGSVNNAATSANPVASVASINGITRIIQDKSIRYRIRKPGFCDNYNIEGIT